MSNVRLTKEDKTEAIQAMVLAKFKDRYDNIVDRARTLTLDVYDETMGQVGNELEAVAGGKGSKWHWLNSKTVLPIEGLIPPALIVKRGKGSRMRGYVDLFSGVQSRTLEYGFKVQLTRTVAWPDRCYKDGVDPADASRQTQQRVSALQEKIDRFNSEVREFHEAAESIVYSLRTSKQVDEKFPELWSYFPAGVKERIKQAVIPMDQSHINEFRKQLPR